MPFFAGIGFILKAGLAVGGMVFIGIAYHAVKSSGRSEAEAYYNAVELNTAQEENQLLIGQAEVSQQLLKEYNVRERERSEDLDDLEDRINGWERRYNEAQRTIAANTATANLIEKTRRDPKICAPGCGVPIDLLPD